MGFLWAEEAHHGLLIEVRVMTSRDEVSVEVADPGKAYFGLALSTPAHHHEMHVILLHVSL
jgi:hypothetical protein